MTWKGCYQREGSGGWGSGLAGGEQRGSLCQSVGFATQPFSPQLVPYLDLASSALSSGKLPTLWSPSTGLTAGGWGWQTWPTPAGTPEGQSSSGFQQVVFRRSQKLGFYEHSK